MAEDTAIRVECVSMKCSLKAELPSVKEATEAGWRKVAPSNNPPKNNNWRSHVGWCPKCAAKYDVKTYEEDKAEEAKEAELEAARKKEEAAAKKKEKKEPKEKKEKEDKK